MKIIIDDSFPKMKEALDLLRQVNGANNRLEQQPEIYEVEAMASITTAERAISKLNRFQLMTLVDGGEEQMIRLISTDGELSDAYQILLAYFDAGL